MSEREAETICTGPVYIFDCEVVDYTEEQARGPKNLRAKKPKPNSTARKRIHRRNRKQRP